MRYQFSEHLLEKYPHAMVTVDSNGYVSVVYPLIQYLLNAISVHEPYEPQKHLFHVAFSPGVSKRIKQEYLQKSEDAITDWEQAIYHTIAHLLFVNEDLRDDEFEYFDTRTDRREPTTDPSQTIPYGVFPIQEAKKPIVLKVDQELLQEYPYVNLFMNINRELTINYPLLTVIGSKIGHENSCFLRPTKNNPIVHVSEKIYDHIVSDANAYYDTVPLKIQRALHQIIDEYLTKNETLNDDEIEWIDHLHK